MISKLGQNAKIASGELSLLSTKDKNNLLLSIKKSFIANKENILKANEKDMAEGEKSGLNSAMLDRLLLNEDRLNDMADSIDYIIGLDDPIGDISDMKLMENGLQVGKMNAPIGVLGIIYESRPNVSLDASLLAIKSSNALILRGGSEAKYSNKAIVDSIREGILAAGTNENIVQLIEDTSREAANELMKADDYLDLLIPRGSANLINAVRANSTVPLLETGIGNCHVYIEKSADIKKALAIVENSKTQRTGVCNALETLLIHKDINEEFYPGLKEIISKHDIKIHIDENLKDIFKDDDIATEEDYYTEYLDMEMAIKKVEDTNEAIEHIKKYGSGHSDAIVTESYEDSLKFQRQIDSACVYVNASTRFTDGGELGMGAEMGISTQKLHARGPIGLNELTIPKIVILGEGQIRE